MDKRYQVFVSSTFVDLKEERQAIMQTLMEMDCIPAGMELFPAADEEQMDFIKKIIDDCDYYLLVIGGRYGSTNSEGVSYTEKEYDYAIEKGIKVVALLHEDPDSIPIGKSERDPISQGRLASFRDKVSANRLVKKWSRLDELPGLVSLSLSKTIKTYPAVGWVRGNAVANEAILTKLQQLQEENGSLKEQLAESQPSIKIALEELAGLDESIVLHGTHYDYSHDEFHWNTRISWRDIFAYISPYIDENLNQEQIKERLESTLEKLLKVDAPRFYVDDQIFQTIKVQLRALNLIEINNKGEANIQYWSLTHKGLQLMFDLRTQK